MVLVLRDFSAWVTIGGEDVEEYATEYIPEKQLVQCWIPSEADKNFAVHWHDSKRKTATDGHLVIDGHPCGGKVIHFHPDKPDFARKEGFRTSSNTIKPFQFGKIALTDDDTQADPNTLRTELGKIELLLFRVRIKHSEAYITRPLPDHVLLHEQAKKGIDHQTTYGKAMKSKVRDQVRLEQLSAEPIARFRFFYRPLEMLQAKGIAPLIGKPLTAEIDPDTKAKLILSLSMTPSTSTNTPDPHYVDRSMSLSLPPPLAFKEEEDSKEKAPASQIDLTPPRLSIISTPHSVLDLNQDVEMDISVKCETKVAVVPTQDRQFRLAGLSAEDAIVIDDEDKEELPVLICMTPTSSTIKLDPEEPPRFSVISPRSSPNPPSPARVPRVRNAWTHNRKPRIPTTPPVAAVGESNLKREYIDVDLDPGDSQPQPHVYVVSDSEDDVNEADDDVDMLDEEEAKDLSEMVALQEQMRSVEKRMAERQAKRKREHLVCKKEVDHGHMQQGAGRETIDLT